MYSRVNHVGGDQCGAHIFRNFNQNNRVGPFILEFSSIWYSCLVILELFLIFKYFFIVYLFATVNIATKIYPFLLISSFFSFFLAFIAPFICNYTVNVSHP